MHRLRHVLQRGCVQAALCPLATAGCSWYPSAAYPRQHPYCASACLDQQTSGSVATPPRLLTQRSTDPTRARPIPVALLVSSPARPIPVALLVSSPARPTPVALLVSSPRGRRVETHLGRLLRTASGAPSIRNRTIVRCPAAPPMAPLQNGRRRLRPSPQRQVYPRSISQPTDLEISGCVVGQGLLCSLVWTCTTLVCAHLPGVAR